MRRAALALLVLLACKRQPRTTTDAATTPPPPAPDATVADAAASDSAPAGCSKDGFCLDTTHPANGSVHAVLAFDDGLVLGTDMAGVPVHAVAGLRSTSLWRVGEGGVFEHTTEKQRFSAVLGGGQEALLSVSLDQQGIWMLSAHAIFHGDSVKTLKPVALPRDPSRTLESIWAAAPDDVWAVGHADAGPFLHFDGKTWTVPPVAQGDSYHAVWGRAANDIWAVGESIQHFDGQNWVGSGAGMRSFVLRAVWARAADDAWAVGDGGLVMHFDGKHWREQDSGTTANLWSVSGTARELWVAGADGLHVRKQ